MALLQLSGDLDAGKETLGGKAWSIAQMLRLGIPVPPAFVLTTDECDRYYEADKQVPDDIVAALPEAMKHLESATGGTFGGRDKPLLVSVRSGAPTSMPGMMDTILNLGCTPEVESQLASLTGDQAYASDTRRRFLEQFEHVVGTPAPEDPWDQLKTAIAAVFDSWKSRRAIAYRKDRGLPEEGGTAVTVQAMVFGNLDESSGTGVLFSRDPLRGGAEVFGEWLTKGQGEDVVSGRHDPQPLDALKDLNPELHAELMEHTTTLENDAKDMQDIEFTVESGKLWLLQARNGKRSPEAAVRLAVLLEKEGLIDSHEALSRVTPTQVAALLSPHIEPEARANAKLLAEGKAACPGLVSGTIVTDVDEAERRALEGEDVILARQTTNPDDVHAMAVVKGIITEMGGSTSHAAVVSRELAVACVVGCGAEKIVPLDGQVVTMDAIVGEVYEGELPTEQPAESSDPDLHKLTEWALAATGAAEGTRLPDMLEQIAASGA